MDLGEPSPSAGPTAGSVQERLDRSLARMLPGLTVGMGVVYVVVAALGGPAQAEQVGPFLAAVNGATGAVLLAAGLAALRWGVPPEWANPAAFGIVLAVYANTLVGTVLAMDPIQTMDFMLVVLGASIVFMDRRWFYATVAISAIGFTATAFLLPAFPRWPLFAFNFFGATVVGVLAFGYRLRTHEELERAKDEIRYASKERLRQVTDNLEDVVWLLGTEPGDVRYLSPSTEDLYGLRPEEIYEDPDAFLRRVHPADRDRIRDTLRSVATGEHPEETVEMEWRLDHPDKGLRWIRSKLTPIPGPSGEVVEITGVSQDITTHRRARRALEDHAQELTRVNEALERSREELEGTVHAVAHEFQEPVRDIHRHLQLLMDRARDDLDEGSRDLVDYSLSSARRLHDGLRDFLRYIERDPSPIVGEPVDLQEVLLEVLDGLQAQHPNVGDVLVTHAPLPTVPGDRELLRELLEHLVGNAVRHLEPGERVHVDAEGDGARWVVSVEDEGPGISPEYHDLVFQPFGRLETQTGGSGAGLGLAICRHIVHRHGGGIHLESTPGEGTTVRFTLPAVGPPRRDQVEEVPDQGVRTPQTEDPLDGFPRVRDV